MWHDPDDRIRKAMERFEEDDVDAARRMLRALEKQGVESPRIDLYLGHCHLEDGNAEAALMRYRRAALRAPRRAEPWIGLGLAFGRAGRLRRARCAFRRATKLAPELEEAHCQLVHCHVLLGEMDQALRVAARVVALDPTCPYVHRHLAVGFALEGRHEEALAAWLRVAERDPDHPELAVGRARALLRLRRLSEARAAFLRAVARDPADAEARIGLGDLAADEGRPDEARDHYRAAVDAAPTDVEARVRFAEALLDDGRPGDALGVLAPLSVAAEPGAGAAATGDVDAGAPDGAGPLEATDEVDDVVVASLEARALAALGRRAVGLARLRQAIVAQPRDAATWRAVGDYLLVNGRLRAARRTLRRAVRCDPDAAEGARLLARAEARCGRRKRAASLLARAARRHPTSAEVHVDVAAALIARGRIDGAERALLRGLSFLPDAASLWAAAAEVSFERGRFGEARARIRSALRRDRRHPQALSALVRWLVHREDWGRAARAGIAASRVLPPADVAVREHGLALLRLARPVEAAAVLRRYVLAAPADPVGYRLLAEALESCGDRDAASTQRRIAQAVGAA